MKRAVWLPNWIGDAVMATPALRLLRDSDPAGELVGIFRGPIRETLAGTRFLTKMIPDRSSGKVRLRDQWAFVRCLQREEFDEIVLLTNSLRTAAVAALARIPRRIGFSRDGRGWLLTHRLQPLPKTQPHPVLPEYLRLAGQAVGLSDLSRVDSSLELNIGREDLLQWEDFAARYCLDEGHFVCLNSGGAFGAAKHWPVDYFAQLALRIVEHRRLPVVLLCGPAERELATRFMAETRHPLIHSLAEEAVGVGFSKAIVKHARAMITTDSGPRHFAAAFGVPVITLFGPTHIAWSETCFEQAVHLQQPVDCGPCQQRICPRGDHRCMRELTVDRVFAAYLELERTSLRRAVA
ncbi:MAG: lipopolysaccharide heptosyltransferase II [Planctomycetaceae bacterium]|nr:lipopolysaccharide heptosyltransferase II [Planctomycetaceae bacterium]